MPTVAGALAGALARAARLDGPPPLVCAGRTDAGVHATAQVVHVDLPASYHGDLARAVNRQLAPKVVVRGAAPAAQGFDARRSATCRRYRYLVRCAPVPEPLLDGLAWQVPWKLDLRTMASASDALLGEHDFRAFCRRPPGTSADSPIVRRVLDARWREVRSGDGTGWDGLVAPAPHDLVLGGSASTPEAPPEPATGTGRARPLPDDRWAPSLLRFDIAAGSFCHQMVRSIVAVLVEAGRGRASAATVMALLAAGSRAGAPRPAPPEGLCLVGVDYEADQPDRPDRPDRPDHADRAGQPDQPDRAGQPDRPDEDAGSGLPPRAGDR